MPPPMMGGGYPYMGYPGMMQAMPMTGFIPGMAMQPMPPV